MADEDFGIILEIRRYGALLRVSAMDSRTGEEISFQAPANTPRDAINRLAVNKLRYIQKKKSEKKGDLL